MQRARHPCVRRALARRRLGITVLVVLVASTRAAAQTEVGCDPDPATRAAALVAAVSGSVGVGERTVALAPGCVYTLTAPAIEGTGLPIVGPGADDSALTIAGNGAIIERADGAPSFRFFTVVVGSRLTLDDLTLRNGAAPDHPLPGNGGAIENEGQLVLHRCTLTGNRAGSDCDAEHGGNGGAIAMLDGTAEIDDSVLEHNAAGCGITGGDGGAIALASSAGDDGPASSLVIARSDFSSNTAGSSLAQKDLARPGSGHGGNGGALHVGVRSSVSMTQSTLAGNYAGDGGPADDSFANGGDGGNGGAIANGGTVSALNCTLTLNRTGNAEPAEQDHTGGGGALYAIAGSTTLFASTTLAKNYALSNSFIPATGGCMLVETDALVRVRNTLFALDEAPSNIHDSLQNCDGEVIDDGGNLQSWRACGVTIPVGDPRLGDLADNGGPTETRALRAGSAAIGAGDEDTCPIFDQRGVRRLNGCDSGAYQYVPAQPRPVTPIRRGGPVVPQVGFAHGTR